MSINGEMLTDIIVDRQPKWMVTEVPSGSSPKVCYCCGAWVPTSTVGGKGSVIPVEIMRDLWWTVRHWNKFSPSTFVPLPIHISANPPNSPAIRQHVVPILRASLNNQPRNYFLDQNRLHRFPLSIVHFSGGFIVLAVDSVSDTFELGLQKDVIHEAYVHCFCTHALYANSVKQQFVQNGSVAVFCTQIVNDTI